MQDRSFGNRITDNALDADNGEQVIGRALEEIERSLGWRREDQAPLFSGVYYDSQKVGSLIVKVRNDQGQTAVLKLQLKPLPHDEGSIIRQIAAQCKDSSIHPLTIHADEPWESGRGYGYLVFEDLSTLPNLWTHDVTDASDRARHKEFLQAFFSKVLPIEPWMPRPSVELKQKAKEAFEHFYTIALKSNHHHVEEAEVQRFAERYFSQLDRTELGDVHFTHGHLSGKDVKFNQTERSFTFLANLYWSWRPEYYELVFPMWVDLMHLREKNLSFASFLKRVQDWCELWHEGIFEHDPTTEKRFWLLLLERSMLTIMLDLGASEWKEGEREEKQALLNCWKEFFDWIEEKKL